MSRERKQYHSIPLRTHQQRPQTPQERTTEGNIAVPSDILRPLDTRAANQRTYAATHSHVPHTTLPAVPDDDRRLRRAPKSAVIRYTNDQGEEEWRQGKQRLVFHQGPPPRRFHFPRLHWLFYVGLGLVLAAALLQGCNKVAGAIQAHNLDSTYGMPRTWQCDAVVDHADSAAHPSHFTFENLHGHLIITELPGGNPAHAHIYSGPTLTSDQLPVTGTFRDVNGDGRLDMLVEISTGTGNVQTTVYLNNGTQFVPQMQ